MEIEVPGRKIPAKPKKSVDENMEEEPTGLNLDKGDVFDRDKWRGLTKRQTCRSGKEDTKRKK